MLKISFVIPAHNEEALVGQCIKSIQDEIARVRDAKPENTGLRNPYFESEIIVVNNVSTDHTKEVALSYPDVKVVDEERKGLVRARQAGLEAASGDIVANIDADVLLPKGWLNMVLKEFEKDPKLVSLSGPFIYYDLSPWTQFWVKVFYGLGFILYCIVRFVLHVGSMVQGGNFVIKRSAMQQAGGYDTSIEFYGEDTDVARKLNKLGHVKWTFKLPVYTSGRRLKGEGVITTSMRYTTNYFWVTFFGKPFTSRYKDVRPKR